MKPWQKLLISSFLVFWGTVRSKPLIGDNAQAEVRSDNDAVNYLSGRNWIPAGQASELVNLRDLLRSFQVYTGLSVTGILDEATRSKMNSPQCGNPDFGEGGFPLNSSLKKRYTHLESRWPYEITWYLENGTPDLNENIVRSEMMRAFQHWADVTPLTFREVFTSNADIIVQFAVRDHGDGHSFDGPGRVLAHAFQPGYGIGGDIHFDDDERFTRSTGINFLYVAVHEVGHSLGMGHSSDTNAIMAPYYRYRANFALGNDDINGIQALYGENCHAYCSVETIDNGGVTKGNGDPFTQQASHGDRIRFTCEQGYTLAGEEISHCRAGEWIPEIPTCVEASCSALENNGQYKNMYYQGRQNPPDTSFSPFTQLEVECAECRVLEGSTTSECRRGSWEPSVPSCVQTEPTRPTRLRFREHSSRVDLTWQAPLCEKRNGVIQRYEYISRHQHDVRYTTRTRYTIRHLSDGERWTFKVRACNDVGCGPYATIHGRLH